MSNDKIKKSNQVFSQTNKICINIRYIHSQMHKIMQYKYNNIKIVQYSCIISNSQVKILSHTSNQWNKVHI